MSNQYLIAKDTTQIPADIKGMWGKLPVLRSGIYDDFRAIPTNSANSAASLSANLSRSMSALHNSFRAISLALSFVIANCSYRLCRALRAVSI
jgi:hypothetical protein